MFRKPLLAFLLIFLLASNSKTYGQSCEAPVCPTLTITGPDKVSNGQSVSYTLSGASSGNIRWSVDNPNASISGNNSGATLTVRNTCNCNNGTITVTARDTQTGCSGTFRVQAGTWVLIRYKWCNCANNNGCGTGSDCGSCSVPCQPAQDVTEGLYRWKFQFGWMCSNPPDSPYIKCKPCADDFVNWIGGDLPSSYTPRCSYPYTCNPPNTLTEAFVSPYEKYEWKCPTTSQSCSTTCSLNITDFRSSSNAIDPYSSDTVCLSGLIDTNNPVTWTIEIKDGAGSVVKRFTGSNAYVSASWDGKDNNGNIVAGGTYTAKLAANTEGGTCADSRELPITVRTVRRAYLKYVSGNNQAGDILTSLENPFVVKVVDENNSPTTGNVTWQVTATPQDAQGHGLSTASGLNTTLTLGDALGNYTVTATCTDCTENTTVAFTAKASGPKITLVLTPENVRPLETGGNNVIITRAMVTSNSGNEYEARFEAEGEDGTGGHDAHHTGRKPVGIFEPTTCLTNNGKCEVKYEASKFGGMEKITAYLINYPQIEDTKNLRVAVEGLTLLPQDNDTYLKIGGTIRHHGPQALQEDHNHYGTDFTISGIMSVASLYKEEFQQRLMINDISLPNGGGFDNGGNWEADIIDEYPNDGRCNDVGHCSHRVGKNVDVDDRSVEGMPVQLQFLKQLVNEEFGGKLLNEGNHYHITFTF